MPIYVYHCDSCAHTFEELVLSREAADSIFCPRCQSARFTKVQAAFATTSGGHDDEPCCGHGACSNCSLED